jgi:4-carboxymuconolactone decarboxylase
MEETEMAKDKTTRQKRPKFYQALQEQQPQFIEAVDNLGRAARAAGPLEDKCAQLIQLAACAAIRSEGGVHSHVRRALSTKVNLEPS